jgi:hypothetical protein
MLTTHPISFFGSSFYEAFSETRLYTVTDRVISDDDKKMRTNIHALSRIQTYSLSIQVIKAYPSDGVVTVTGTPSSPEVKNE